METEIEFEVTGSDIHDLYWNIGKELSRILAAPVSIVSHTTRVVASPVLDVSDDSVLGWTGTVITTLEVDNKSRS